MNKEKIITLLYTNWRGQTSKRSIIPIQILWDKTEWHPHEQWLIKCWDLDKEVAAGVIASATKEVRRMKESLSAKSLKI